MNNSFVTRTVVTAALAFSMAGLSPMAAATEGRVRTQSALVVNHVRVSYADLDLQSEAGAQTLVKRLSRAAIDACGGKPVSGPIAIQVAEKTVFEACRKSAIRDAVQTVDRPMVTAAFTGQLPVGSRAASR